ncbi:MULTISPECIES: universal stress protein [unclassified Anabaena]|uniref:universal stress protein n=1 Tax=unclassified Anabaena TaxID=2619674 RepID=UPI0008298EB0|nr:MULTISPECIES: universal stress protein [unclassified Anabaena]
MLARLQSAMGRNDLTQYMVLLPDPKKVFTQKHKSKKSINFIVGYDASPESHTALDIAFWMAHQTRLATNKQVTVQAVYVVEENYYSGDSNLLRFGKRQPVLDCAIIANTKSNTSVLTQPKQQPVTPLLAQGNIKTLQEADRILWQARSLAEEWQDGFKSHLRFGQISTELKKVVEAEAAELLFLGCKSVYHPLIKTLGSNFPSAVLGIPHCVDD